jgi:ubiquitin thioesterase protein OTUB1
MKTHPENYAGYMIGQTVDQYCDEHIMPMDSEIDHLGLSALKDVILSPASLALEALISTAALATKLTSTASIPSVASLHPPSDYSTDRELLLQSRPSLTANQD